MDEFDRQFAATYGLHSVYGGYILSKRGPMRTVLRETSGCHIGHT